MIGWSYGGFLSALAVLDAPDTFRRGLRRRPADRLDAVRHALHRALSGTRPGRYDRNSIVADAPKLERPLMLIHGFADDNVTIANSLRLSQALMAAGRKHTFLPLNGITHMTNDETVARKPVAAPARFPRRRAGLTVFRWSHRPGKPSFRYNRRKKERVPLRFDGLPSIRRVTGRRVTLLIREDRMA